MKPDKLTMAEYFDAYGALLTEKQQECLDLYCNQDYSLAEIAELQGTSRQSVYDAISRAQTQLLRLEEVTHCLATQKQSAEIAARLEALAAALPGQAPEETAAAIRAAAQMLRQMDQ